jgi:hypothetical protein
MPKRRPAISDETLRRELGLLDDGVLLLPQQVILVCGLSEGQLKEHRRTDPPKPPLPEPRTKPREAPWYSLGACRRYRVWKQEQAVVNAETARRKSGRRNTTGFAEWLNSSRVQSEPWPCALVGPYKRPVDAWATIRGEVTMERSDRIEWLTLLEYLDARSASAKQQGEAEDRVINQAAANARAAKAGTVTGPPRVRPRP